MPLDIVLEASLRLASVCPSLTLADQGPETLEQRHLLVPGASQKTRLFIASSGAVLAHQHDVRQVCELSLKGKAPVVIRVKG